MNLTPTIAIHLSAAVAALAIGPVALWARKGRVQRPALHRAAGYVWVMLMVTTAVSAFFIRDYRLPNINGFTLIHALIPWVLICLIAAFWFLKQGKIDAHRKTMGSLYWGACVGAGLLTLTPERYLGGLLWGGAYPNKGLLIFLTTVLQRTPSWVWVLLVVLVVLGWTQTRTRSLSLVRLAIVPLVMLFLSLLGTVQAAGWSLMTLLAWLTGYSALVVLLSRQALPASVYDAENQRFTVAGSYWPLCVMLLIFVVKFLDGVMQSQQAALLKTDSFALLIALAYGAMSGFFAGRAWRYLKLSPTRLPAMMRQLFKPLFKIWLITSAVCALLLGVAITFGGPKTLPALDSVNKPFLSVDFSALPPTRTFTARDGRLLAYLHYPAQATDAPLGRVVLVHGSSANARSMHVLAQGLSAGGFAVDAMDMRGHGAPGKRGHIAYIGQLEDDITDFIKAVPSSGRNTLMGFSSGGGFALRFAGSEQQGIFSDYVLLSPYLKYDAPTVKPRTSGWVSIGIPRLVALQILDSMGFTALHHLKITQFALNDRAKQQLTAAYDFSLAANFGPHLDYLSDIAKAKKPMRLLAGEDDELFYTSKFAEVFAKAGKPIEVTLIPRTNHIGLTLNSDAVQAVVNVTKIAP